MIMKINEIYIILILLVRLSIAAYGQTIVNVYIDSVTSNVDVKYKQGVFYVPKTNEAQNDFLNNNIYQNAIRLNIIESALNNSSNLTECLQYLDLAAPIIQSLSTKTNKLFFIFEKMPPWLSSSSDGSPASVPGWSVLNTKPPANWVDWDSTVVGVVNRIVNTYGITNAYFEIWNEPDLGSWTGTQSEYFLLIKHTYNAIKSVNSNIPVGGPATNYWGNNINYKPPYGYLSNQIADSSLIGQLIDSTYIWNKPLDFISWHNFNITYQTNKNATDYIIQKYTSQGLAIPQLIISEWNTPSSIRDTPLQKAFFIKNQMEMAKLPIDNNMVAAWQDFYQSTNEFHNDYGLLTYGSIHKPVYNALLLSDKIKGVIIKNTSNVQADVLTAISNDTLNILISNYVPPAFIEAFNHTLFEGHFNAAQLDSAGYINMTANDVSMLDSIYKGLITIPNSNPINIAINNSISIYNHYDSLQTNDRIFNINITGITGIHQGKSYKIDSTNNNQQFKYDSLLSQGYTQTDAIAFIRTNQPLISIQQSLNNGQLTFAMQPNAVQLFQFKIPDILIISNFQTDTNLKVFPNPMLDKIEIKANGSLGIIKVYDISGKILKTILSKDNKIIIDMSNFSQGIYLIQIVRLNKIVKVIKK